MENNVLPKGAILYPNKAPTNNTEKTPEQIEVDRLHQVLQKYNLIILVTGVSALVSVIGFVIGLLLHVSLLLFIFVPIFVLSFIIMAVFSIKHDNTTHKITKLRWDSIVDILFKLATGEELTKK